MDTLIALLGQPLESRAAQTWLDGINALSPIVFDWSDEGEPPAHYLESKVDGVCISHSAAGRIESIFLMSSARDGFSQYRGELGHGLSFSSSPQDVMHAYGTPSWSRPPQIALFNRPIGEIMRYDYPEHSVHFQFRHDGPGIEKVTLMTADHVPGRTGARAGSTQRG